MNVRGLVLIFFAALTVSGCTRMTEEDVYNRLQDEWGRPYDTSPWWEHPNPNYAPNGFRPWRDSPGGEWLCMDWRRVVYKCMK